MFDRKYSELKVFLHEKEVLIEDKALNVIERKKQELEELEEEIIEIEIKVLNRELERLNKTIDIESKRDLLNKQMLSLKFLRNEKSNKEMSDLYLMLSGIAKKTKGDATEGSSKNEVIDINVEEGSSSLDAINHVKARGKGVD